MGETPYNQLSNKRQKGDNLRRFEYGEKDKNSQSLSGFKIYLKVKAHIS
jgi:hypothetical protein